MKFMGGKHGKYAYILRNDGWYVKTRILKSREDSDPQKYIVVGPKTKNPPPTYHVIREDELPEEVKRRIYEI